LSRLRLTFREFIAIIEANGFTEIRHGASSHRRYRGVVSGEVRLVTVAYHKINAVILHKTLDSMIRQSGLLKRMFRG
jgi:predicted RNA binding protein YcfA (HicA-like mRNA interferase family)